VTTEVFLSAVEDCYGAPYPSRTMRALVRDDVSKLTNKARDILLDAVTREWSAQYKYPPDRAQIAQTMRAYNRSHALPIEAVGREQIPDQSPPEEAPSPEELRKRFQQEIAKLARAKRVEKPERKSKGPGGGAGRSAHE
jgi:hypothetical protein